MPDKKKSGDAYITVTGIVKRIDEYFRILTLIDGTDIPIDNIVDILSDLTEKYIMN